MMFLEILMTKTQIKTQNINYIKLYEQQCLLNNKKLPDPIVIENSLEVEN